MTSWALWIRAETEDEAAAGGKAWADAEPNLIFEGVLSVEPREFHGVWTVTVAASEIVDQPTLGPRMTPSPRPVWRGWLALGRMG